MSRADFKRSRALSGGHAAAMSPLRFAPLRKVVEAFLEEGRFERERLECGHVIRPRSDMIGPTNAYRRRCLDCLVASCEAEGHLLTFKPDMAFGLERCKCGKRSNRG